MAKGTFTNKHLELQAKHGEGIIFCGQIINLSSIAKSQGLSRCHLSRAFRGHKGLSIDYAKKVASYLGMGLEEFLDTLDERVKIIRDSEEAIIAQHLDRIEREDKEDMARILKGMPPVPRLPGLRAS